MQHLNIFLFLGLVTISFVYAGYLNPDIDTQYGQVRGLEHYIWDVDLTTFYWLGIPYAKPPVGQLRFEKPEKPEKWVGTRNAYTFAPGCTQGNLQVYKLPPAGESEDCLYLNVFAPEVTVTGGHPVMVYIHGGAFISGSAYEYGTKGIMENLVARGVVVVTINYRLGALGFLSSNSFNGNWGIYDQVEALRWVQGNIAKFGGNPKQVTIFGESAGAMSVSILSLIPDAQPLFHRSISQSGSALAHYIASGRTRKTSDLVIENLGCKGGNTISCLKSKTVDAIKTADFLMLLPASQAEETGETSASLVLWGPEVDGRLIPEDPEKLIARTNLKPAIIGTNEDEMVAFVRPPPKLNLVSTFVIDSLIGVNKYSKLGIESVLGHLYSSYYGIPATSPLYQSALAAGRNLYIPKADLQVANQTYFIRAFIDLQSDVSMHIPALQEARLRFQGNGSVWLYNFNHYPSNLYGPEYPWRSAHHMLEVPYIFDSNITGPYAYTKDQNDVQLTNIMGTLWTNFAKFGDPTPKNTVDSIDFKQDQLKFKWPAFSPIGSSSRAINLEIQAQPKVGLLYHYNAASLWLDYLPFLSRVSQQYYAN